MYTASLPWARIPTASTPCGRLSCRRAAGHPPHVHSREEEGFYVLEGEITFEIGGERLVAGAGTFANMSVGTPHSLKNESDRPAKMLVSVAPAGLERMFFEVGQPVDQGATTAAPMTEERSCWWSHCDTASRSGCRTKAETVFRCGLEELFRKLLGNPRELTFLGSFPNLALTRRGAAPLALF